VAVFILVALLVSDKILYGTHVCLSQETKEIAHSTASVLCGDVAELNAVTMLHQPYENRASTWILGVKPVNSVVNNGFDNPIV
jgi:hypothetical protein